MTRVLAVLAIAAACTIGSVAPAAALNLHVPRSVAAAAVGDLATPAQSRPSAFLLVPVRFDGAMVARSMAAVTAAVPAIGAWLAEPLRRSASI